MIAHSAQLLFATLRREKRGVIRWLMHSETDVRFSSLMFSVDSEVLNNIGRGCAAGCVRKVAQGK